MKNIFLKELISQHTDQRTIYKAKHILEKGHCTLSGIHPDEHKAVFMVNSDAIKNKRYRVVIDQYHTKMADAQCNCPYDWGGYCKHIVASIFLLDNYLANPHRLENLPHMPIVQPTFDPAEMLFEMRNINEQRIRDSVSKEDWLRARKLGYDQRATITPIGHKAIQAEVPFKNEVHFVKIRQVDDNHFETSCSCSHTTTPLCLHKAIVFLQLRFESGAKAFHLFQDWDEYKNKLLEEYGYSLEDDLNGKFSFKLAGDKPELIVHDPTLLKISQIKKLAAFAQPADALQLSDAIVPTYSPSVRSRSLHSTDDDRFCLAYVLKKDDPKMLPGFDIVPIMGKAMLVNNSKKIVSHINVLSGNAFSIQQLSKIDADEFATLSLVAKLSPEALGTYLVEQGVETRTDIGRGKSYTGGRNIAIDDLSPKQKLNYYQYLFVHMRQLFQHLTPENFYALKDDTKNISINNIEPLLISDSTPTLSFSLDEDHDKTVVLRFDISLNNALLPLHKRRHEVNWVGNCMLVYAGKLYLPRPEDVLVMQQFMQQSQIRVRQQQLGTLLEDVILPLQGKYEFHINVDLRITQRELTAKPEIFLKETNDHLIIQPLMNYEGQQKELDGGTKFIYVDNYEIINVDRQIEAENQFADLITSLHAEFAVQRQENAAYYYLTYEEVVRNHWFLDFFATMQQHNIEIYGFKDLQKFKYNANRPTINFQVSSGIDWFDIEAEVSFGDQTLSLREVQKAIIRNEHFVKLGDGTLGILPEEWIRKYATLFKMSDAKGKNQLRIAKIHFSLVEELYDQIQDQDILAELREKKQKLREFTQIKPIDPPKLLEAMMRPYQKEGFNWLCFLDEFRWGGCLADDMGLGKTLQVLAFVQYLKEKGAYINPNLVVAPTSLIFNWEAEIEKFTPSLSVLRHHGTNRNTQNLKQFDGFDIVLTSYTTMASDIEMFSQYPFHYAILDESQAIKNPDTKRYKTARLLNAYNRIALTGTPIENNTFDLYAQINFLNPGMLGSIEFFKEEFANPIDRYNHPEKTTELKRIIYPFILRRTKKMVAQDLPEKTETVLFCEMAKEQREVYNAFKNEYRSRVLSHIDSNGIKKSGMYILQGLMKLRQICNSPAILDEPEDYGNDAIKLRELMEQIDEIASNHKILVFSQFLSMLRLIKDQLEERGIQYTYLDGATSTQKRQEQIEQFQSDDSCRIFLISLKAGGVGLNLTAADYVFLVDPWWNPAVETQAIDRAHRIGQVKNVFAYKMICKDTVEEKILQLQNRKRVLADDLIGSEHGFIKQMTRADVEFLFS